LSLRIEFKTVWIGCGFTRYKEIPLDKTRYKKIQLSSWFTPLIKVNSIKFNQWSKPRRQLDFFIPNFIKRYFFISSEPTPNPDSLKFYPEGQEILKNGSLDFPTARSAIKSPLAQLLFTQEGVKRIFLATDFITVTKDDSIEWEQLVPIINGTLMEFYSTGKPVLLGEDALPKDTLISDTDSDEVAMIKELIETRIRPAIQSDGGDVTYLGFKDGIVFVKLSGSCSGCPSSSVTLKNGIERMLMHWVPEVTAIMEVETEEEFLRLTNQLPNIDQNQKTPEQIDNDQFLNLEKKLHRNENL